mgnify:CR=1 FL=1
MKPINDTFLKALQRQKCEYTPLWLMRQAGRYLAEYNATRAKAGSFLNLAHSPSMACEVTLQPVDRFGLDAAILFSDILIKLHRLNQFFIDSTNKANFDSASSSS